MKKNFDKFLNEILKNLPVNKKLNLQDTISKIKDNKVLLELLQSIYNDFEYLKGKEVIAKISIIGPPNTGKSSLFNRILGYDYSKVAGVAGTTTDVLFKRFGPFLLTDTPGLGQVSANFEKIVKSEINFSDVVILVFDITTGFMNYEFNLVKEIISHINREKLLIVFNKIDLLDKQSLNSRIKENNGILSTIGISEDNISYISVKDNINLQEIILFLLRYNKYIAYDIAKLSVIYKEKVSLDIVNKSSIAAGTVGFTPIPLADIIPITAIQLNMILQIAKIYNKEIGLQRAKELLPVFAGGFVFRSGFRQLIKLLPFIGDIGAGVYSAAVTYALGRVAIIYFSSDKPLNKEQIKQLFQKFFKERALKDAKK